MLRDVLVPVLVAVVISGCVEPRAYGPPPADAAPPPPPAAPASPPSSGGFSTGAFSTVTEYDRGVEEGRRAGAHAPVAGYFVGGAVLGGILAPLCVIAVLGAGKGGGGGGNCGGGNCDFGSPNVVVVGNPQAQWLPADYQSGFTTGYQEAFKPRKTHALIGGFAFGFVLAATATVIYFANAANDSGTRSSAGAMTAAHGLPPGGLQVRF